MFVLSLWFPPVVSLAVVSSHNWWSVSERTWRTLHTFFCFMCRASPSKWCSSYKVSSVSLMKMKWHKSLVIVLWLVVSLILCFNTSECVRVIYYRNITRSDGIELREDPYTSNIIRTPNLGKKCAQSQIADSYGTCRRSVEFWMSPISLRMRAERTNGNFLSNYLRYLLASHLTANILNYPEL